MRIDQLYIKNFRGFDEREFSFVPGFNLIVGVNGTGKTSLLDALSVAVGSWLLGLKGYDSRHIAPDEVRLAAHSYDGEIRFEPQFPVSIKASGPLLQHLRGKGSSPQFNWERSLTGRTGRTTTREASLVKLTAKHSFDEICGGKPDMPLPLISYYGTGRLWQEPRQARVESQVKDPQKIASPSSLSRFEAYRNSVNPRLSVRELVRWIARQAWISFQQGKDSSLLQTVRTALIGCVEGAENLYFDARRGEVVVEIAGQGVQPFMNLSDGQRSMLALVGDLAQKAATLNPQFGTDVLEKTVGVVLIDELDLHLHPRWQRRVIEDLRRTFPLIQFICTTHSPFLIQSLRSGEELIMLDGQPTAELGNKGLDVIARDIMGIAQPEVSVRYEAMRDAARSYLEMLDHAPHNSTEGLAEFKERLADAIAPFADNPAFQAFLELKRAAKLGE